MFFLYLLHKQLQKTLILQDIHQKLANYKYPIHNHMLMFMF
jgi:hypothetical protein